MALFSTRFPQALLLAAASFSIIPSHLSAQSPIESLKSNFKNPPDNAKPMMRWWWFGTAVEKPEILRELQQMKADGIGGAELAFVSPQVLDDPAKNLINKPFVGPAMLDNVRYAQAEGRKLGLRIDVTLASGWPYGGPATTLAEAAGRLRVIEVPIPSGTATVSIPFPDLQDGESVVSTATVNTKDDVPANRSDVAPRRNAVPQGVNWDLASAQTTTLTMYAGGNVNPRWTLKRPP